MVRGFPVWYADTMRAMLIVMLAALFVVPEPAYAGGGTVYVQASVGMQTMNLKAGTGFVDRYTASRFVYGKCRNGYRCIIVQVDKTRERGTGWASWNRADKVRMRVTVTVNPAGGSAYMKRLFAHEIGHAMFLPHSKYSTNLMWAPLHVNGNLVKWRFTEPQKHILRRN